MYVLERRLTRNGWKCIAGVDEAGRGPLAGPVVAAAVILPRSGKIRGIRDSKKLSPQKRDILCQAIITKADVGIAVVSERLIDKVNIYQATRLAMKRAILKLTRTPEYVLIDGPMNVALIIKQKGVVNGDARCASIAAASIVAKVTRDKLMLKLHQKYPQYRFDKHKGYPTKEHVSLLSRFGPSPFHRVSYKPVQQVLS